MVSTRNSVCRTCHIRFHRSRPYGAVDCMSCGYCSPECHVDPEDDDDDEEDSEITPIYVPSEGT